ncbi:MAG: hypothetical protein Q4D41_12280, partial [Prevotellaceae bacterium]|nr:hypothetical protein [Prevotellaceae bacterium]
MKVIRILLCMVFCLIVFVTTLRAEEKEIMFYVYKTSTDETDLPKSDRSITGDITVFLDRGELLLYPLFIDKFSLKLTSVDGAVLFD